MWCAQCVVYMMYCVCVDGVCVVSMVCVVCIGCVYVVWMVCVGVVCVCFLDVGL